MNYTYVKVSAAGLAIWALAICAEVLISIPWLRDHGNSPLVMTVVLTVLGLTFVSLLLFFSLMDIFLGSDALSWKRRAVIRWLFRMQPPVGEIRRSEIRAFRVDRSPWSTRQSLMLLLHGNPPFEIPGGESGEEVAKKFQAFVLAFRAFVSSDSSHAIPELENIWKSPTRRMLIGIASGIAALVALSSFFLIKISGGQLTFAACAVGFSVLGVLFLLKRT